MEVSGYIMNPGMKEYYQNWVEWYQDGLIDENYLIQKPDQYQEKAASGRLALFLPALDLTVVRQALKDEDPDNDLRPIPWPETSQGRFIDPGHPAGWGNLMFNKDFENIPELIEYFDWFQSDEAQVLMSWGPESNDIWEVVDGQRRFTDTELAEAIRTGTKTADGRDGASYGIDNMNRDNVLVPSNRAYLTGPAFLYERNSVKRSWPFEQDAYIEMWYHLSGPQLGLDGTVLPGRGPLSNEVGGYYWGTTRLTQIAQLLSVNSDAEFDQVWEAIIDDFLLNTPYEAAVEEMRPHFEVSLGVDN
jgi:ABC-type glycerol-3-phosphate transport system substrate-binding protein